MTIARIYKLTAADGKEQALLEALIALGRVVRQLKDCIGVELLRDCKQPGQFLFIEKWPSIKVHKTAGALLPRDSFSAVMSALAAPPEGSYQEYVFGSQ